MAVFSAQSQSLSPLLLLRHRCLPTSALFSFSTTRTTSSSSSSLSFARYRYRPNQPHHAIMCKLPPASASVSHSEMSDAKDDITEMLDTFQAPNNTSASPFLPKFALMLGIAATVTLVSVYMRQPSTTLVNPSFSFPRIVDASSDSPLDFTLALFGKKIILPERTPGWVYFWLLMAAGCGLFVSEEALNVWVGVSLARTLSLDGTWQSLATSFSANAPYIISTVLWVYWGVCISDMIPFYIGKFFRESKASESIYNKLGIGREKVHSITRVVQKYGNLSGFIERFSIGARNTTAFLAGASGVSADCFFAGVCCGGLITLSLQLAVGFLARESPVVALASVAAFVGIWTVFPYLLAAMTALVVYLRQKKT